MPIRAGTGGLKYALPSQAETNARQSAAAASAGGSASATAFAANRRYAGTKKRLQSEARQAGLQRRFEARESGLERGFKARKSFFDKKFDEAKEKYVQGETTKRLEYSTTATAKRSAADRKSREEIEAAKAAAVFRKGQVAGIKSGNLAFPEPIRKKIRELENRLANNPEEYDKEGKQAILDQIEKLTEEGIKGAKAGIGPHPTPDEQYAARLTTPDAAGRRFQRRADGSFEEVKNPAAEATAKAHADWLRKRTAEEYKVRSRLRKAKYGGKELTEAEVETELGEQMAVYDEYYPAPSTAAATGQAPGGGGSSLDPRSGGAPAAGSVGGPAADPASGDQPSAFERGGFVDQRPGFDNELGSSDGGREGGRTQQSQEPEEGNYRESIRGNDQRGGFGNFEEEMKQQRTLEGERKADRTAQQKVFDDDRVKLEEVELKGGTLKQRTAATTLILLQDKYGIDVDNMTPADRKQYEMSQKALQR